MHSNIHNKYQKDNLQLAGESGWKLQLTISIGFGRENLNETFLWFRGFPQCCRFAKNAMIWKTELVVATEKLLSWIVSKILYFYDFTRRSPSLFSGLWQARNITLYLQSNFEPRHASKKITNFLFYRSILSMKQLLKSNFTTHKGNTKISQYRVA